MNATSLDDTKPRYDSYFSEFHYYIAGLLVSAKEELKKFSSFDKGQRFCSYGYAHGAYDILSLYYVLHRIYNIDYEDVSLPLKSLENLDTELCFIPPNYSILQLKNKKRDIKKTDNKYKLFLKEFVAEIARIVIEKEKFILMNYIEDINYEYESSYLHQYGMLVEAMITRCDEIPKEGEEDMRYKYVYQSDLGLDQRIPYIVIESQMKSRGILMNVNEKEN